MKTRPLLTILLILLTVYLLGRQPGLTQGSGPPPQPASLIYDEMRTVYLGNLARRYLAALHRRSRHLLPR